MCIGESAGDTLDAAEQAYLTRTVRERFPAHAFALRRNDDGITWGVLEPDPDDRTLPLVTICRIDPCIMVMLEDTHARRQFRALPDIATAVDFLVAMADQAMLDAAGLGARESSLH